MIPQPEPGGTGKPDVFRVALLAPPSGSLTQTPPIHLGYLASSLRDSGFEARIFDFKRLDSTKDALLSDAAGYRPNLIGITAMTVEMPGATWLTGELKRLLPGVPVVLGGIHPTVLPAETLAETKADFVARGEGEKIIVSLANALSNGDFPPDNIPGITHIKDGLAITNPDEAPIENLDTIPFPAWDLIPPGKYSTFTMQLYKRRPVVATIHTTRGCPGECSFCSSRVRGRRMRFRSPANIADEVEWLVRDFSVGEIHITDDNFSLNRAHAMGFCEEIIRRKLDIVWKTPQGMRIDTVDDDLMRAFGRAGCYELGFGIESSNREILSAAKKGLDLSIVQDRIRIIKKHGIEVYGFFILGLPGETRETAMDTIRFMRRGFDHISVSFCIPYPGSAIYENYVRTHPGPHDWGRFAHHHIFTGISDLNERDLKYFMRRAVFGFYLHPRRAFLLMRKLKSIPLRFTLQLIFKYLGPKK